MPSWRGKLGYADVTPKAVWLDRRRLMAGAAGIAAAALLPRSAAAARLQAAPSPLSTDAEPTSLEDITHYNNFYEFGVDKGDPARHAGQLTTEPWSVVIDGMVGRPGTYPLEDIVEPARLEERIYRLRCVEGWSMVIPWIGFPLSRGDRARRAGAGGEVTSPSRRWCGRRRCRRSGASSSRSTGPMSRGCRIDEAMHPLTILAVGLYGEELPNQNGAPLRLVVPWKYGFKSIKSIVRISFTDERAADHLEPAGPERVRLLFERQPGGRPPALEPGERAGGGARGCSRRGATRRCSTATATRSPTSTPAWTCGSSTDHARLRRRAERRAAPGAGLAVLRRRLRAGGDLSLRSRCRTGWAPTR